MYAPRQRGVQSAATKNPCLSVLLCPGELDKVRWTLVNMPSGGWLGSRADEGRAKLR